MTDKYLLIFPLPQTNTLLKFKKSKNLFQDGHFSLSLPLIFNFLPPNYNSANVMAKTYPHFE